MSNEKDDWGGVFGIAFVVLLIFVIVGKGLQYISRFF